MKCNISQIFWSELKLLLHKNLWTVLLQWNIRGRFSCESKWKFPLHTYICQLDKHICQSLHEPFWGENLCVFQPWPFLWLQNWSLCARSCFMRSCHASLGQFPGSESTSQIHIPVWKRRFSCVRICSIRLKTPVFAGSLIPKRFCCPHTCLVKSCHTNLWSDRWLRQLDVLIYTYLFDEEMPILAHGHVLHHDSVVVHVTFPAHRQGVGVRRLSPDHL